MDPSFRPRAAKSMAEAECDWLLVASRRERQSSRNARMRDPVKQYLHDNCRSRLHLEDIYPGNRWWYMEGGTTCIPRTERLLH